MDFKFINGNIWVSDQCVVANTGILHFRLLDFHANQHKDIYIYIYIYIYTYKDHIEAGFRLVRTPIHTEMRQFASDWTLNEPVMGKVLTSIRGIQYWLVVWNIFYFSIFWE